MENINPILPILDAEALPLTLEAIYEEKIFEAAFLREPHWMQDNLRFSYLGHAPDSDVTTVMLYDVKSGERTVVIDAKHLRLPKGDIAKHAADPNAEEDENAPDSKANSLAIPAYQWSPDEKHLLIARLPHRRAAGGDAALYVYTLADKTLKKVTPEGKHEYKNAKWSPDSRHIGYVREDDIYTLDTVSGKETRLTDSAAPNIYNGRFGWVYEEELDLVDGWAWSPDGKHVAYFHQDENQVPQINLPNYDDLHMKPVETRYPKAGDPNPIVKIGVVPTTGTGGVPNTKWMDIGADTDIYIVQMQWTPKGELLLQRMPRLQNKIEVLRVNPVTGASTIVLTESDKAWIDKPGELQFVTGTEEFFWPSDRSGFKHLYLYDLSGKLHGQLTSGEWDVENVCGVDAAHRMAYFIAARPSALERQMYSVLLDGGGGIVQLTDAPGQHRCLFAPDGQHYLDTHTSRATPSRVRLHQASGQHVADVHDNPMPKLQGRKLAEWEFTTFTTSDGVVLNASLLKPANFDATKKYPVLMYTYGGPGSQVVQDTYGNGGGLEQMLAQKGYIFAMVDGRGSGFRGRDFMKMTYLNLGHYEVGDQIEGAKWLAAMPFVDAKRIGIWGWSYGGYMSCLCITRGAEVFKTAVAVAPVTHWNFYDSIYTERYMRRPIDNPKGYEESSPITYADKMKGNFLLVAGTADDNVHFQNAARLAEEFQKKNKTFRAMYYPGKHHGLEGVSMHVFGMITAFIEETL